MKIAILVLVVLFIVLDLIIYFLHKIKKEEIVEEEEKECQPPVPLSREEKLEQENTEYTFGHNVHRHYIDGDE